ncbi:hypothetical protein [Gorillibacterium sp. CAU 1737]|uniref:hypothetical protein n=1 Tax=Gorillibacterium sp. CAU 1737 TaxID=3140362 RepID=UPI0032604EF8
MRIKKRLLLLIAGLTLLLVSGNSYLVWHLATQEKLDYEISITMYRSNQPRVQPQLFDVFPSDTRLLKDKKSVADVMDTLKWKDGGVPAELPPIDQIADIYLYKFDFFKNKEWIQEARLSYLVIRQKRSNTYFIKQFNYDGSYDYIGFDSSIHYKELIDRVGWDNWRKVGPNIYMAIYTDKDETY